WLNHLFFLHILRLEAVFFHRQGAICSESLFGFFSNTPSFDRQVLFAGIQDRSYIGSHDPSRPKLFIFIGTSNCFPQRSKKDKKTTINQNRVQKVWRVDGGGSDNGRSKGNYSYCLLRFNIFWIILLVCPLMWPQSIKQHSFCSGSETLKPSSCTLWQSQPFCIQIRDQFD
ncbi:hypothetical protein HID58_094894, partial [Brassica napus]